MNFSSNTRISFCFQQEQTFILQNAPTTLDARALPGNVTERSAIELLAVCTGVALKVMLSILDERREVLNISEHPAITKTHSGRG
jgi:hypothetical protein